MMRRLSTRLGRIAVAAVLAAAALLPCVCLEMPVASAAEPKAQGHCHGAPSGPGLRAAESGCDCACMRDDKAPARVETSAARDLAPAVTEAPTLVPPAVALRPVDVPRPRDASPPASPPLVLRI
jgi:hypothetical protein